MDYHGSLEDHRRTAPRLRKLAVPQVTSPPAVANGCGWDAKRLRQRRPAADFQVAHNRYHDRADEQEHGLHAFVQTTASKPPSMV